MTGLRKLFPHPLLALTLVLMWLLLTNFSLGHLILGSVIATISARLFAALEPEPVRMKRFWPLVKLFFIVGGDIIRSNWAVAHLILTNGRHGKRHSAFVEIQLKMKSEAGLALLAMITTATPGTAWLAYDSETGVLLLHVFDMIDSDDWQELISNRYEALLMEVFE